MDLLLSAFEKKLLFRINYVLLNITKSLQRSSIRIVVPNYPCKGLKKDTYYPVKWNEARKQECQYSSPVCLLSLLQVRVFQ